MTIDGKNIYSEWGCTLLEGSFDTLLKYPKRKAVTYRNWAEADGIDPDLSVVEFETKNVKLDFLMEAESKAQFWNRYQRLIAALSFPGYRAMNLLPGMIHHLRFNANSAYEMVTPFNAGRNLSSFTLDFIEDTDSITAPPGPLGGISLRGDYAINGIDFGAFGIGSDDEGMSLLKYPSAKPMFTDGRSVDFTTVKMQHKEIKLSLWMLASSVEEFVNNYRAFFAEFTAQGTQELYIKTIDGTVWAYYTDCPSFSVEIWEANRIGIRFSLTLVAPVVSWIDAGGDLRYRVLRDKDFGLLADENGRIIVFN